jgi:hypothetical protein
VDEMLKSVIKKIIYRVRQRFVLSYIFEGLGTIGIQISPWYLSEELSFDEMNPYLKPKLEPVVGGFLSLPQIEKIYTHPESKWLGVEKRRLFQEGCLCFGLMYNNEIVAYTWCNLHRCHEVHLFPLKDDEAYITETFTFKAYRGKNLAPFMRYQLKKHLNKMGRTKVYSFTNIFNTPAIKFKKKLMAKPFKIILCIKIFNKYDWNFMLGSPRHFMITM